MQTEVNGKFKSLISSLDSSLKNQGFKKRSNSFYLQVSGNWGIVNFQKSTKSTRNKIEFTVNFGIASTRILKKSLGTQARPDIWDCQWQVRLGHLLEAKRDLWWTIDLETPIDQLSRQFQEYIFNYGIPELLKYIDDTSLRDLWLSGKSPSLTKIQRLRNLSILIKEIGPEDLLNSVESELVAISKSTGSF